MTIDACICDKGYFGAGYDCAACPVGTYINVTKSTGCLDCPGNSTSLPASPGLGQCLCIPGFTGRAGGPCNACPERTYKDTVGTSACTPCPANTYSNVASGTASSCICLPGSAGVPGNACPLCVPGTYQNLFGKLNCTVCPAGSMTLRNGSVTVDECVCRMGYEGTGNGRNCTACNGGYKNFTVYKHMCACMYCVHICSCQELHGL